MHSVGEIPSWVGTRVEAADGRTVGRVEAVQPAALSGYPAALVVRLSDGTQQIIALRGARRGAGVVRVPLL